MGRRARVRERRVVGGGGTALNANGALVSFDATDGSVTSVLPYSATRAKPRSTLKDGKMTLVGDFRSAWDKNGKNLAPNGTRAVIIDMKTGVLLTIQK